MNNQMKSKLHSAGFKAVLAAGVLLAGMGLAATANAAPINLSGSVGGVPNNSGVNYENFNDAPLNDQNASYTTASGIQVSFLPDAQAVQGAQSGQYAAPFLSSFNGTLFGDPTNGADSTTYLTSGANDSNHPNAGVTLNFTQQQKYLGLLWGSVDDYNTLTFYSGGLIVGTFTGADVGNSAGLGNCIGGDQGELGTCYVNINFSMGSFDTVIATSSQHAFEFDNVAFSAQTIRVPEPGVAGMFLLGMLLLGSVYWLKRRESRED
ncbi:MAG: hypothetical protein ABI128_07015 [Rhodanobacter sp.]